MPKYTLSYFDIEGIAEKVRLSFALAGIEFIDDRIAFNEWDKVKQKTPHGMLPILTIDEGPAMSQSEALLRYVATIKPEAKLNPPELAFDINETIGVLNDMRYSFFPLLLMKNAPELVGHASEFVSSEAGEAQQAYFRKKWIKESLPKYLSYIAKMIEKNGGKWLVAGDKPTIADAHAIPILRSFTMGVVDYVEPDCLCINPVVVDYVKRFCALPQVKGRYRKGLGKEE